MDGTQSEHPLSDSQLDREIQAALGIEPSPEFLARVRTRVAAEPRTELWRLAIRRWTFEPLAGVAVIGVVLAVVVPRFMRNNDIRTPAPIVATVARTPVEADLQVGRLGQAVGAIRLRPVPAQTRADSVNTVPLQLSPVLFAEDDRAAFALFVTAVADGRVPERVVQALGEEDMTPLAIAPLEIAPLPALARVNRQGEGQW